MNKIEYKFIYVKTHYDYFQIVIRGINERNFVPDSSITTKRGSQVENTAEINKWIETCSGIYAFNRFPVMIHNQKEFSLSILAGLWLLHFYNDFKESITTSEIFHTLERLKIEFPHSNTLWNFLLTIFTNLNEVEILEPILEVEIPSLDEAFNRDTFGTILQLCMNYDERKKLAVNYTTHNSAEILVSLTEINNPSSIVDPFCGSGRLITTYLSKLDPKEGFPRIRINDLMPSAVLIAYCRLILLLSRHKQSYNLLEASIGDAFEMFPIHEEDQTNNVRKYDLVLMNPPFTRTHRIDEKQKAKFQGLKHRYKNYITGQVGLHIYAMLLADTLIKENGMLGAILPAATILSQYSSGIHKLLLNSYQLSIIAASEDVKSCSENSSLREIILIAQQSKKQSDRKVNFLRISEPNQGKKWGISSSLLIPEKNLAKEWNWTVFLRNPKLLKFRDVLLQSGFIKNGKDLHLDIVRGVEMYGPDFFYIPNREWKIISETDEDFILKSEKTTLTVPRKFLVRSLRKPSKYTKFISPKVLDFALTIPNLSKGSQKWIKEYLRVSEQYALPAKRKFGSGWIFHIHTQLLNKQPWGHLFFIDKFGISSTSIMAHFSEKKLTCSKNFYLLRNSSSNQAKLLAAWLNSTFFIVLFLLSRREIGGSYGRLQIIDYMKESLFFDFSRCDLSQKRRILEEFDKIRKLQLPAIPDQLQLPQRKALDLEIAQGLKFSKEQANRLLNEMYNILKEVFLDLEKRDKS